MSAHATFSPSAAHRWMTCPGSIALTRDAPRTSNAYADEGTAAHELAQRALTYGKHAVFFVGEQIQVGERIFLVDHDMAEYVQVYLDEVRRRVGNGSLLIEQRVTFSDAIGVPSQFGTADAIILSGDGKRVQVIDLKYGQGVRVECAENEQLLTYGAAVLETFDAAMGDVQEVELVVVQPRLDHIDAWECSVERIREHAAAMRLAAQAALEGCTVYDATGAVPEALLRPAEDACRFCAAKVDCPALRRKVSEAVFDDFKALDDPEPLTVAGAPEVPRLARLGHTFGLLDMIEDWCRSVRGEVERLVMGGMTVIGPDDEPMKVIEGKRGNRKWIDEGQAEATLAGLLGPKRLYKPREVITPSAAAKLLGKGASKAQWAELEPLLVTQAPGKPKVTLGSDPAPPYTGAASGSEFADLGAAE